MNFVQLYQSPVQFWNFQAIKKNNMKLAIFLVSMMQSFLCNAIFDAELAMTIQELQSQKIDMQEVRKQLDKVFQAECENLNF